MLIPHVPSSIATHLYEAMKLNKKGNTQLHSLTQQILMLKMSRTRVKKMIEKTYNSFVFLITLVPRSLKINTGFLTTTHYLLSGRLAPTLKCSVPRKSTPKFWFQVLHSISLWMKNILVSGGFGSHSFTTVTFSENFLNFIVPLYPIC